MAKLMDIPVLGVIENYSYLTCPDCGRKIEVFGKSRIEEIAAKTGLALAGRIPIEPSYSE
jgi:Mrp family chromosome partitioning ATPase